MRCWRDSQNPAFGELDEFTRCRGDVGQYLSDGVFPPGVEFLLQPAAR